MCLGEQKDFCVVNANSVFILFIFTLSQFREGIKKGELGMKNFRLKCLLVLGVFFVSGGSVFAECPEITGTFLCGRAKSEIHFTTTVNDEGQYVYRHSSINSEKKMVVYSYIADGVPRVTEWLKRMSICSDGSLKVVHIELGKEDNNTDSKIVYVRNYSIDEKGNLFGGAYFGSMEHENLESLMFLKQHGVFYCHRQ